MRPHSLHSAKAGTGWKMSAPHTIIDNLPSLCQKLSDLVEVSRSYNKNNFACFFDTVYSRFAGIWERIMITIYNISCNNIL